jgi:class 3 adenylate cyclase
MRPFDVMTTINEYLKVATDTIQTYKGIIDKYMGAEIMVLYNAQLNPMDNHSLKAVETALALRDAFVEMYARTGIKPDPHFYRVGINTGVVTLGNVGSRQRRDFTAIGDSINLAKRLEENATNGQIIISEYTLQHIERTLGKLPTHMRFEEREALQVKGRSQFTRIFEVFRA